jgi:hypothetical protein
MKQNLSTKMNIPEPLLLPPAYPHDSRKLLRSLREELSRASAQPLTFARLAQIMGVSRSTAHYWFHDQDSAQLQALFCLLERLSPGSRSQYIQACCREYPRLEHPRLAQVPGTARKLRRLLRPASGLTFLCGGSDASRTFVLTAMGHALADAGAEVRGIDLHQPVGFVPVDGVYYLRGRPGSRDLLPSLQSAWLKIASAPAACLLLNGLWSLAPSLQGDILRAARHRRLLIAEMRPPHPTVLRQEPPVPMHRADLSSAGLFDEIRVEVRRI